MLHPVVAVEEVRNVDVLFGDAVGLEEGGDQLDRQDGLPDQFLGKGVEDYVQ